MFQSPVSLVSTHTAIQFSGGEARKKEGKRKTCWVAWEEMMESKHFRGVGLSDIELFNLASDAFHGS